MRSAILATTIAIAGCGNSSSSTPKPRTSGGSGSDAAPAGPMMDLASVPNRNLIVLPGAAPTPAAFVSISATGAIEMAGPAPTWLVASRGKWVAVPDVERLSVVFAELRPTDDPPPPEEDDLPDDDAGSGQSGSGSSGRAVGQYKMKKEPLDPELARVVALEKARNAGVLGSSSAPASTLDGRAATAEPADLPMLSEQMPIVFAPPKAPAVVFARVAARVGAMLAVNTPDGVPAVFHVGYHRANTSAASWSNRPWTEIHVEPAGLVIVRLPKHEQSTIPWKADAVDRAALLAKLGPDDTAIDVLVRGDVTMQRLVDVIVALEGRGVSIGESPGAPDERVKQVARLKALRHPVSEGAIASQGDLDKALIRQTVRAQLDKVRACYEKRLLAKPGLQGTVSVNFLIKPTGAVGQATANGVDPDVSACIANEFKKFVFPKPKGGGMVQVSYPLLLRPTN